MEENLVQNNLSQSFPTVLSIDIREGGNERVVMHFAAVVISGREHQKQLAETFTFTNHFLPTGEKWYMLVTQ